MPTTALSLGSIQEEQTLFVVLGVCLSLKAKKLQTLIVLAGLKQTIPSVFAPLEMQTPLK
jgi:hypothetical protein